MFKDSMSRWLTKGLFYEINGYDITHAIFTTADEDKEVKGKQLLSFKRLYLETEDPTEYQFAKYHLGGWSHWKAIQKVNSLKDLIEDCREEMEIMLRSRAIGKIAEYAETEKGYQAAKFLADRGWDIRKAGAPSKEEKAGHQRRDKKLADVINGDFARLKGIHD